jgi:LruC domain-containing protein
LQTNAFSSPPDGLHRIAARFLLLLTVMLLLSAAAIPAAWAQAVTSVQLTDVIKSQGTGNIDLFKDVTAEQLEALRLSNGGALVFAVDINEDASGSEKASSQGVAVKSVSFTVDYDDGSQLIVTSVDGCCSTETQALLAEAPFTDRSLYYTLLGESGSSRITANNTIQEAFDSTLKVTVPESLSDPAGRTATGAKLQVVLLQTNDDLGDPEAYYDFSAGFEDLALLNSEDAAFIDNYGAGREEAPTVILTNPPPVVDLQAVANWNYFPSASSFFVVGYEDLYPGKGDYDFNDLTVAYRLQYGLNVDGDVVAIQGLAYLITRGSAYSHDWRLAIDMPGAASGNLDCTLYPDYRNPTLAQGCANVPGSHMGGALDIPVFNDTLLIFPDPAGSLFVNSQRLYSEPWNLKYFPGPRAEWRLDLDQPIAPGAIQSAPYDPYLYVRDTGQTVKLMEVDPSYQDSNGFPFGMLLTTTWKPPLEFTDTADAYPNFLEFVTSEGASAASWYTNYLVDFIVDIPDQTQWAW